jgi:hypothetical protein
VQPTTVILRSKRRRRAQAVQKLQHVIPALVLLGAGMHTLTSGAQGGELAIGFAEIVSGALFVTAALAGLRSATRGARGHAAHHHGIDWVDVFAAVVIAVETVERYHRTGHVTRPNVLLVLTLLVLGVFHGRVLGWAEHRRAFRLSDEGLSIGGRPFRRRLQAPWSGIRSIDVRGRYATITLTNGRTKQIDLDDLEDAEPLRAALEVARERVMMAKAT